MDPWERLACVGGEKARKKGSTGEGGGVKGLKLFGEGVGQGGRNKSPHPAKFNPKVDWESSFPE